MTYFRVLVAPTNKYGYFWQKETEDRSVRIGGRIRVRQFDIAGRRCVLPTCFVEIGRTFTVCNEQFSLGMSEIENVQCLSHSVV
jgi:hypothetical protein